MVTVTNRKEGMKKKIYVASRVNIAVFCTINIIFVLVRVVRSSEANLSWQGTWEILLTSAVLTSELERWCLVNYRRTNRDCGMILSIRIRLVNMYAVSEALQKVSYVSNISLEFWLSECPSFLFSFLPSLSIWTYKLD